MHLSKKLLKISRAFILLPFLSGCDYINPSISTDEEDRGTPVARVEEIYLYKEDIAGLVRTGMSAQDSMDLVDKYISSWVKKQLMISKASTQIQFKEAEIDRKVLDYKYALMIHEYEKYYINQHLEKEIPVNEIEKYYEEKFENFVLRQNIIRCLFAIIPKEAPQIPGFRQQIRSFPNSNLEEIQSYCYRFAVKSSLEPGLWLNFDEVITNTPLANIQDRVSFLKNNSFIETSDENNYFLIRLLDYKISNQISPLEFVSDDIENILINKKKIELRKKLEDEIYQDAVQNDKFEMY